MTRVTVGDRDHAPATERALEAIEVLRAAGRDELADAIAALLERSSES